MSRGSKVVFGAKGAVLHEPRARLVASMFTFWAKKMEYRVEPRRTHRMPASSDTSGVSVELTQTSPPDRNSERQTGLAFKAPSLAMAIRTVTQRAAALGASTGAGSMGPITIGSMFFANCFAHRLTEAPPLPR